MKHSLRRFLGLFQVFFLFTLLLGQSAEAQQTKRQCIRDTNVESRQCIKECTDTQTASLLVCSANGNTALEQCFQGCLSEREECLKPFQDANRTCHDACFTTFDAAMTACDQNQCNGNNSSAECNLCRLQARVTRFSCALNCRATNIATFDDRKSCRVEFRGCIRECRQALG